MRDLIGKRKWFFAFSLALTIPGFIFILLGPLTGGNAGLQFSIDYTGGTRWEIRLEDRSVTSEQVMATLAAAGHGDSSVRTTSEGYFLIQTRAIGFVEAPATTPAPTPTPATTPAASPSPEPTPAAVTPPPAPTPPPDATTGTVTRTGEVGVLAAAIEDDFGPIESQRQLTTIGPVISAELTQQAIFLVFIGSIGILLWMTFRFRDFRFGMTALVALVHDVIIVL
ncbi:MAG TPA: hypothetical protein VLM76_07885, partial [Patescibacteria group bacterium]|nr:hypothetical protein [Patescibacteria group bacterium]